jgi:hypothetical protein
LYKNVSNPSIDRVVLFVENCGFPIKERLTYKRWFEFASIHHPCDIKILTNSDIFLDETISVLDQIAEWNNVLYVVSRKDLTPEGKIIPSQVNYMSGPVIVADWSQDCWVYKEPLPSTVNTDYMLGVIHCETELRKNCIRAKCDVVNLFEKMNCIHVDWRAHKHRTHPAYKQQ